MKADLKGKVAVLTGAGGGIGSATAEKLAKLGMKLVLLGGNNLENSKGRAKRRLSISRRWRYRGI